MKLNEMLRAAGDFWRPNRCGLKRYLLRDGKEHPFAVICPGGGYSMVCSFLEGLPYATALNAMGYHAFVVYYRVRKKARYPAPQEDLAHAVREIFQHAEEWQLDTRCYSLWGSSAGGHLAASFCTGQQTVPLPGALILSYPVITMGEMTHPGSRDNLLGGNPSPAMIEQLSVEKQVGPSFPPTYLWCGTADTLVDPENSCMLAEALEAQHVRHRFETFANVGHGTGIGKDIGWFEHAVSFWEAQRNDGVSVHGFS